MQISTIRGKADLEHNRNVVKSAVEQLIIPDPVVCLTKNFSKENFLKGGLDACGGL